ncbi:MAG TPA: DUF4129 domain-containing protein [Ilumatobacteraceae bacterium]|nr:DUF4129 domain-containing protein [Ilumatobacteraceae bacterium]
MRSRTPFAVVVSAAVVVLLVFAASSQPVQLWIIPTAETGSPSLESGPQNVVTAPQLRATAGPGDSQSLDAFLKSLAVVVLVVCAAALIAIRGWWPSDWSFGADRARRGRRFVPVPEVADSNLDIDLGNARAALSVGRPSTAIIACWIRLEADVAAAGWPRSGAETSVEYTERIVATASVDPNSIAELAALYREARFSDHLLNDTDRAHAIDALSRVERGLRSGVRVPS